MQWPGETDASFGALQHERTKLVRLCARLTGDWDAAEDLAQETLLVAWRNAHKLYRADLRFHWLAGIAKNVCLQWARQCRQERQRHASLEVDEAGNAHDLLVAEGDIEVELERAELVTLLDQALALLTPDTRAVLIARYVNGSPHAEIAARLGISEKAVSMRLSRGKLQLKRVLSTTLRGAATAFDLGRCDADVWQATQIWCSICGQRRLLVQLVAAPGTIAFRCPACSPSGDDIGWRYPLSHPQFAQLLGGASRPRSMFRRMATWAYTYYADAHERRTVPCTNCGAATAVHFHVPDTIASAPELPGYSARCAACGTMTWTALNERLRGAPAVQQFAREHERIRTLPVQELEVAGQPALLLRVESLQQSARLDILCARDTFQLINHPSSGNDMRCA